MLLPALTRAKVKAQGIQCVNNSRQFIVAWLMYADENNETLVLNKGAVKPSDTNLTWCAGDMTVTSDRTNAFLIENSLLFPYVKSLGLYKCPGNQKDMLRGFSMNDHMGTDPAVMAATDLPGYQTFTKQSNIRKPSDIFVTIDEDDVTINDAWFLITPKPLNITWTIYDWPATYHGGGSGISFADGHAEIHHWKFLRKAPPGYSPTSGSVNFVSPNPNADTTYLDMICTLPKSGGW